LGGPYPDEANNGAVESGDKPAMPHLLPDEDCRGNGQQTRYIVEPKHYFVPPLNMMDRGLCGDWSNGQISNSE
jgi:hypothetical protein